jgi:hypothetical protein
MSDIFISYRRGDSAGHAGRLFDCVRERFGDESVFMDVTDIRPGDDFVTSLDSALSSSRIVLAVIGPDWLTCTSADGRRRLDDPNDHLRLEVAHALRANARVIPVLVRAARMPSEGELPDDLKALARRQAQEVSDSRWSYDTDQLVRIIENALGKHARHDRPDAVAPVPLAARLGSLRVIATAAVSVVLMALALYSKWLGRSNTDGTANSEASTGSATSEPAPDAAAPSNQRRSSTPAARLPPAGEARAGPAVFKMLGGLVSRDGDGLHTVRLYVRTTNVAGRYGYNISLESFRLLLNDEAIAPEEAPIEVVAMQSATDEWVTFRVPANAAAVQLQVGEIGKATAKIPFDLASASTSGSDAPPQAWKSPVEVPLTVEKRVGQLLFDISGLRLEHVADSVPPLQPERLELKIKLRIKNLGIAAGYALGGDEYRLFVDDVPLAPTTFPIQVLNDQTEVSADVIFVMPGTAKKTVLQLGDLNAEHIQVPLDLSAAHR